MEHRADSHPVDLSGRNGPTLFQADEHNRTGTTLDALAALKPAFRKGGTITAGNAPRVHTGAAAMALADETWAERRGRAPSRPRRLGVPRAAATSSRAHSPWAPRPEAARSDRSPRDRARWPGRSRSPCCPSGEGRFHLAGIDHAVLFRALFVLPKIDRNQHQLAPFFSRTNSDAPRVGRAGGLVELHTPGRRPSRRIKHKSCAVSTGLSAHSA